MTWPSSPSLPGIPSACPQGACLQEQEENPVCGQALPPSPPEARPPRPAAESRGALVVAWWEHRLDLGATPAPSCTPSPGPQFPQGERRAMSVHSDSG